MNIQRARRAAAAALLAAGGLMLLPAAAHADTCMLDDKGHQVCGASGFGPAAGQPGAYTGVGVNNGTPGAIGPDGQPMTAATPPAWSAPGYEPPPAPAPAPNNPGVLTGTLPPGVTAPGMSGVTNVPAGQPAQPGAKELPPTAPAGDPNAPGTEPSSPTTSTPASAAPTNTASAKATPVPTMTEMIAHTPPPTKTATPEPAAVAPASQTDPFNPVPLLVILGGLAVVAGAVLFVPGIRSAAAGLLRRGGH